MTRFLLVILLLLTGLKLIAEDGVAFYVESIAKLAFKGEKAEPEKSEQAKLKYDQEDKMPATTLIYDPLFPSRGLLFPPDHQTPVSGPSDPPYTPPDHG